MFKNIEKSGKIPCAFCQGKGAQPGDERLSCIVCGGSGQVAARQPYSICKECEGIGRRQGAALYCLACHGKGFVEEKKCISAIEPRKLKIKKTGALSKKRKKSFLRGLLGTFKML